MYAGNKAGAGSTAAAASVRLMAADWAAAKRALAAPTKEGSAQGSALAVSCVPSRAEHARNRMSGLAAPGQARVVPARTRARAWRADGCDTASRGRGRDE